MDKKMGENETYQIWQQQQKEYGILENPQTQLLAPAYFIRDLRQHRYQFKTKKIKDLSD